MFKDGKILYAMFGLVTIALLLSIPQFDAFAQTNGDSTTIEIGALLHLGDDGSASQKERLQSMQLAVSDFNTEQEGLGTGYKVNLTPIDITSDTVLSILTDRYDDGNGLKYFLGPTGSADSRTVKDYANENGIILISPSSSAPSLALDDTLFRLTPDDYNQGPFISDLVEREGKAHTVVIYSNETYGIGLKDVFAEFYDGTIDFLIPVNRNDPNNNYADLAIQIDTHVKNLVGEHTSTKVGVLHLGFAKELTLIINAILENDTLEHAGTVNWYGGDAVGSKPDLLNVTNVGTFPASVHLIATQFEVLDNPINKDIQSRLTELGSASTNNIYLFSSYDSLHLLADSIIAVDRGDEPNVKDAIFNIASGHSEHSLSASHGVLGHGALGDFDLNEFGDLSAPISYSFHEVMLNESGLPVWIELQLPDGIAQTENNVVQIGALLHLGDDDGFTSHKERLRAMQIAADNFNEDSHGLGASFTVEIIPIDITAATVYDALVDAHKNQGILYYAGPSGSGDAEKAKDYATRNGLVLISPGSTATDLAIEGDYLFRLAPDDSNQVTSLVPLLADDGKEQVVVIYVDDTYGIGLRDLFIEQQGADSTHTIEIARHTSDSTSAYYDSKAIEVNTLISSLVDTHGADHVGVLYVGFPEAFIPLVQSITSDPSLDTADDIKWYGADEIAQKGSIISADSDVAAFAAKVTLASTIFEVPPNDVNQELLTKLEAENSATSNHAYLFSSYEAVHVLTDIVIISENTGTTVHETLDALVHGSDIHDESIAQHHDISDHGALGDASVNDAGDLSSITSDLNPIEYAVYEVIMTDMGTYEWMKLSSSPDVITTSDLRMCR